MKTRRKSRLWLIPGIVLGCVVLSCILYLGSCHRASQAALDALRSDEVLVEETDYGWFFDGPSTDSVLVFYPGGKVEAAAYAPLLHALAGESMDVCLVKMPLNLAFLNMNAASKILTETDYENRYIGGHSLGGAAAAICAAKNDFSGVILLAAYPTRAVDRGDRQVAASGIRFSVNLHKKM